MTRTFYLACGVAGLFLAAGVAVKFDLTVSDVAASPSAADTRVELPAGQLQDQPNIDSLVAQILDRPLFTPGRRPPASQPAAETQEAPEEVKTAPELRGRLAGVTLGPDDLKEAVFAREGEKPLAVKEGEQIDGWTVTAINPGSVVLTSEFGERTLEPTAGAAGEGAPLVPIGRRPPQIQLPVAEGPDQGIVSPTQHIGRPNGPSFVMPGQRKAPAAPLNARRRETQ